MLFSKPRDGLDDNASSVISSRRLNSSAGNIYIQPISSTISQKLIIKAAHERPSITSKKDPLPQANMKLAALTALVSLASASPILERETPQCSVQGVRGAIPTQIETSAFRRLGGIRSVEQCNAQCRLPENKQCKAFTVRTSGGGACLLYSAGVAFRPDPTASVVIYNLPEGVRGGTPHNNPAW